MEITGGEPDVVGYEKKTGEYTFYDCSAESPKGRKSICYDHEALELRKENKPKNNAVSMASAMGIELLTETQYRQLQTLGNFDTKISSWVQTPSDIKNWVVHSFATGGTTQFSYIIMGLSLTTPPGDFVAG